MPISDLTQTPEGQGPPGQAEPGGVEPAAPEPPTIVRTSSSTARRMQLGASLAPVTIPLPQPGEGIASFLLEEAIGVGGMGAVYRARDTELDRPVALKLLPPDQAGDAEMVQRFYQEGRSAAQLDHENIARVYSIGRDGPHHFIAFEFIEGVTVRRRVDDHGPLPVSEAVDITLQIAHALVHAAARGVVHRDIKPSNIILTPQGRAKLVDMGLARRFERESDHGLTQSGMTLGTFDYISPEQARDPRDVDVRSDLYSLGCTIFHMLTGQPPFPGGTVLQKLLQHQEEPPPEIRTLNPSVPPELSRLITRLLAKDRDRRVQSPEQLVRDLLVIAGHLGLTVLVPEQHAWLDDHRRLSWLHHMAWLAPALGFLVVLGGLVWWARELNNPLPSDGGGAPLRLGRNDGLTKTRPPASASELPAPAALESMADADVALGAAGRGIAARPADDLIGLIAAAPPRSIITLVEDGPYLVGGRNSSRASGLLSSRDVTIRAEAGARPVLRFASDARLADRATSSLLAFSGGNVTLEGLTFELDDEAPEDRAAAVSGEDTELTIRGCMFRHLSQLKSGAGSGRAAIRSRIARGRTAAGDRPQSVFVEYCHFDAGQVAVSAEGPADLTLRDCTLGPGSPSIRLDNRQAASPVPADLRLKHSSFLAGSGPVLEIDGTLARIQVDDVVVAPGANPAATLVSIDNARNLTWRGRGNLYGKLRGFLETTQGGGAIADFERWASAGPEIREQDSSAPPTQIWSSDRPLQPLLLDQENPTQAFALARGLASAGHGARQGPFGARLNDGPRRAGPPGEAGPPAAAGATAELPPPEEAPKGAEAETTKGRLASNSPSLEGNPPSLKTSSQPQPGGGDDDPSLLPAMPPMTPTPDEFGPPAAVASEDRPESSRPLDAAAAAPGAAGAGQAQRGDSEEDLIRSAEQFVNYVNRLGPRGGTLKIAREADLELPAVDLPPAAADGGAAQWQIEAERGGSGRPRLRFRPSRYGNRPPSGWATLFHLKHANLNLHGLDIVIQVPDDEAPSGGRLAAFGLGEQAGLTLANCTLTVAGKSGSTAAIAVQEAPPAGKAREGDPATLGAVIRVEDCFLRSAGDGILVAPDRLLDLQFQNAAIATDGSLLHALGSPHLDRTKTRLTVRFERSVFRTKGGLAFLESPQEDAELPLTSIEAFSSIFSTAGQGALLRVEGRQGQMDRSRDRIVWKADRAVYDQITTYRRDQVLQTGLLPRDYSRSDWRTAFEPKDESPVIESIRFFGTPERWRSACSLTEADFRLDTRSPAYGRGPDLSRIPTPPRADL